MNNKDLRRLEDIMNYCKDIADTINRFGNDLNIFLNDVDYKNSISMSLMQIGELSVKLTDEFKDKTKEEVQWGEIRGMRNMLAHAYSSMEEDIIWKTAIKNIPELLAFCNRTIG
jgi:uncharacterized protein with HEPN domain